MHIVSGIEKSNYAYLFECMNTVL